MEPAVTLEVHRRPEAVHIAVAGELDLNGAPPVVDVLTEHRDAGRPVVLDLSQLSFMDSSGIALLIDAHRRSPGKISFVAPSGQPLHTLGLCGLLDKLPWASAPGTATA